MEENSSRRPIAAGLMIGLIIGALVTGWYFSNRTPDPVGPTSGAEVMITLLQLNDVYEITPLAGQGGLARVATLKRELQAANPNTYALIAGDLVSPSAVGQAKVDGKRLAGKQMIATLNAMGMDYATLGNHEFDITESELLERLQESSFTWISSNVTRADGGPFPGVVKNLTFDVDQGGQSVKVGIFGLTLDSARRAWVEYDMDLNSIAKEQVRVLREEKGAKIVLALTHLNIREDISLAKNVAGIDLILGGHEHENIQIHKGPHFTPIVKADANARSAYIHQLRYRPHSGALTIDSDIVLVTGEIADEPETARVVEEWTRLALDSFRAEGIHPEREVAVTNVALNGLEAATRNGQTELTRLLVAGMRRAFPESEGAIINSGTIRIDDIIPAGQAVSEYDVLRILPFGNKMALASIEGSVLQQAVEQGDRNQGKGGYLQRSGIEKNPNGDWLVAGEPLQSERIYLIVISDFLLTGMEEGLAFLKTGSPGIEVEREGPDLRSAFMNQLKAQASGNSAEQE